MSKLTVSMFWQGPLSLYEKACMLSFIEQGFDVALYSYQDLDVPDGVQFKDAQTILDQSLLTKYTQGGKKGSPTAFSNIFRYQYLAQIGGIWSDADIVCLRPASDYQKLLEMYPEQIIVAREDSKKINGAVMMTRKAHPLAQKMFDTAMSYDPVIKIWGTLGPLLITDFVLQYPEQMHVLTTESFYPIHYQDFIQLLDPQRLQFCQNQASKSYGLHLWNAFMKQFCIPQNILPPEKSYLHQLFKRYFPDDFPCLPERTLIALFEGKQATNRLNQIKSILGTK